MLQFIKKVFGDKHSRVIKQIEPMVGQINALAEEYASLSEEDLIAKTAEFKQRLADGETLDDLLPEAYAVVKDTCRRFVGRTWKVCGYDITWDMVHYDVQIIGAIALHQGKIAEMATGEGKTLVATMPVYLNALSGEGVHVITVNDYLARRDSEWMGKIYEFHGLTVGCIQNDMDSAARNGQYGCDVTFGTNNEFGFDYLRDNMVIDIEDRVQRNYNYAIIDEVDNILIDEARTPLIISGPVFAATNKYAKLKPAVEQLVRLQRDEINKLIAAIEQDMKDDKWDGLDIDIYIANSAAPKNRRLRKLLEEPSNKKLLQDGERHFLSRTQSKTAETISEEEYFKDLYFYIEEKRHSIDLTEKGRDVLSNFVKDRDLFILPDVSTELSMIEGDESLSAKEKDKRKEDLNKTYAVRSEYVQNISQLLRAYMMFERDNEYVVQDGKVQIVDEFTGRLMPGRRYSDGLHQALEAKEGVKIEAQTQTLATITLQNYFRMYEKLAGMTGTAETEAKELYEIYKLDVLVIPTHRPIRRLDFNDQVYRTKREKYNAIIDEIERLHHLSQPVLVGTISVEVSELLSRMLKRKNIPHSVLNAKQHEREAEIVARAGQPGTVTIATNMAGRGTDIKLGQGVVWLDRKTLDSGISLDDKYEGTQLKKLLTDKPSGLHVIGTERHESRRIDRQLRGRSGRQGDPGSSTFYLSLEDDLMRLFGSDRMTRVLDRLGAQEGEVIQHGMINSAIERAQRRVEGHNFSIRKHLLEYDNVMNQQREVIYDRRLHALEGTNLEEDIDQMIEEYAEDAMERHAQAQYADDWDWENLQDEFFRNFMVKIPVDPASPGDLKFDEFSEQLAELLKQAVRDRKKALGEEDFIRLAKVVTLSIIDQKWRDHLFEMDQMKEGIGLRAYGQKDPLIEYKKEAFTMFVDLINQVNSEVLRFLFRAEPSMEQGIRPRRPQLESLQTVHDDADGMGMAAGPAPGAAPPSPQVKQKPVQRVEPKVGRNDPCPCGSGKKYKKCCGKGA